MKRFVLESTAWLLCLAAVSLASCGDDGNDGGAADSVPKELSVAPAELSFVAAGETKTLAVKARNVEWHAATAADWLTLVSDSGTADGTVSVKADPIREIRRGRRRSPSRAKVSRPLACA